MKSRINHHRLKTMSRSLSRSLNENTNTPLIFGPRGRYGSNWGGVINLLDYDHWKINLPHRLLSFVMGSPVFYDSCRVAVVASAGAGYIGKGHLGPVPKISI